MSFAATIARRAFSSSRVAFSDAVAAAPPVRRPVGGVRGGIIGFLAGFSVASGFAAYQLLEEYKVASAALQSSIEQLQANTQKVSLCLPCAFTQTDAHLSLFITGVGTYRKNRESRGRVKSARIIYQHKGRGI